MKYRTGRTCSRGDFAIQNIPIRTELGRELQMAFVERVLVSTDFDYEGMELRACVDMTGEQYEAWVKAQSNGAEK